MICMAMERAKKLRVEILAEANEIWESIKPEMSWDEQDQLNAKLSASMETLAALCYVISDNCEIIYNKETNRYEMK